MNLRVSPRRRWLWLGTWKGEALRLSGSLSAWLGLGGPGAVSDVVPYARMKYYFSKRRRDSLCAAACTYATAHSRRFRTFRFRRRPRPNGAGEHRAG